MKFIFSLLGVFFLFNLSLFSQDCTSQIKLVLENIDGGFHSGKQVILTNKRDGSTHKVTSNARGEAVFTLPCREQFDVKIEGYTRSAQVSSSEYDGALMTRTFGYSGNMAQTDQFFKMSDSEKRTLDAYMRSLPDTTFITDSRMRRPKNLDFYAEYTFTINDISGSPLVGEEVTLTGEKRNKSFKGKTNPRGQILIFLPKGDTYHVSFKHHKNFNRQEIAYKRGTGTGTLELWYLGTKEVERRMKIEADRIAAEEERLKKEHEEFVAWCKKEGITEEEGHLRRLSGGYENMKDTVISATLNRNRWSEKLIVCDLTGSMDPYASQLAIWYQLNYKKEPNLQFVFFNDGDGKSDQHKVIGNTGGIYYQPSLGLDSLAYLMSRVRANGNGGDCAENNMEALIKGVKQANPFKEVIMVVDNNAPVKDIELLDKVNYPVHIILCGAIGGQVLLDYLLIAWKTKGSIHTIEEDITKIAGMLEGDSIKLNGHTYRIMGGEFILAD